MHGPAALIAAKAFGPSGGLYPVLLIAGCVKAYLLFKNRV